MISVGGMDLSRSFPCSPSESSGGPLPPRPARSRRTAFVADPRSAKPRALHEAGNPDNRLRVEHSRDTLLVHLSGEDGGSWTVMAVDRATRRWAVAQARRQLDAATEAFARLYPE